MAVEVERCGGGGGGCGCVRHRVRLSREMSQASASKGRASGYSETARGVRSQMMRASSAKLVELVEIRPRRGGAACLLPRQSWELEGRGSVARQLGTSMEAQVPRRGGMMQEISKATGSWLRAHREGGE